jgi:DNA-binding CsgD family transcriptional regulator
MLSAAIGREAPAAEAEEAWRLTAGNPLLLRHLARGHDPRGRSGLSAASGLSTADVLLARFAGLPPSGTRLLQAAAVLAPRFRPAFALRLAELDGPDADDALDAVFRSGLVIDAGGGTARFTQPLLRQIIQDDLGAARRGRLQGHAFGLLADSGHGAELARDLAGVREWYEQALGLLDAADLSRADGLSLERVQVLLGYGRFLRRTGHPVAARPPLALAARIAADHGAGSLAAQASEELRVAGGRRRRRCEPDRLTPQEQRVAELAATRLSNKEIADRLFLSVKTIETHLGHVYAKLGVRSRRELAEHWPGPSQAHGK